MLQARLRRLESALVEQGQSEVASTHSPTNVRRASVASNSNHSPVLAGQGVRDSLPLESGGQSDGGQFRSNDEPMRDPSNIIVEQTSLLDVPPASHNFNPQQSLPIPNGSVAISQLHARSPVDPFHDYMDGPLGTRLTPTSEQDEHLDILTSDGQPSYYGPTSQRYVKDQEPWIAEQTEPKDNDDLMRTRLNAAPGRNFLMQIFFRAQQLSTPVVDEALFAAGRAKGARGQWYSSFLENAILACASRMSTSPSLRQLSAQHAERAKQAVLEEISAPNNATLQGLLLLSDFEATRGRNRLGYMFCGMACRLVFDIGLTASCTMLVARGQISQADAFERHRLLLAAHVYDKLWSVYM